MRYGASEVVRAKSKSPMKAKDFDEKFDRGENVSPHLDLSKAARRDHELTDINRKEDAVFPAIVKSILVGSSIGLLGVAACALLIPVLLCLRELGLLVLLFSLPPGAYFTWRATKKYLLRENNRVRGAIAFGLRYCVIGAGLALFLKFLVMGGEISDTPFDVFCGSAVGTFVGSFGGAFCGWLGSSKAASHV
jgi:hypothetical protein